ncbi:MAG TPA: FGGY-family carbohydrate kinase [Acidimicrobiales bacterium]|nr:FGGY-family carbohydrate kinase [Acidimicrobiales bacterium]
MSGDLVLSVDLGTGGPKVGLVSADAKVVAFEHHAVTTHFGADGAATQDAAEWWSIIVAASRRLLAKADVDARAVRAVAVTGQYASTVPVDANGEPTGPCLTWLDTRGGPYVRRRLGGPAFGYNPRAVTRFVRISGGAPSTAGADPIGQILYLTNTDADLVARTRWFMEPVDYLTMRLTGVASATHASRLAAWLTDIRNLARLEYDQGLADLVGVDLAFLPPLATFGSIVGTVRPDVATDLGLGGGVAVIAGMPDLHAAALGSGAVRPHETHLALSTTSWISCPVATKKTDALHSIATAPGLTNDSYLVIDNQETGAKSLDWLRATLAGAGASATYEDLTNLATSSPPGANGATFAPWLAGERSPVDDKRVRASFSGLSVTTTAADMTRAVLEGVAANSAWLLRYVEKFTGRRLEPLRLLGGGAQSSLWCQIYADTLGRCVEQVPQPMLAQLRGAATMASVALGRMTLDDVAKNTPRGETYQPSADAVEVYRARRDDLRQLYRHERKWVRR